MLGRKRINRIRPINDEAQTFILGLDLGVDQNGRARLDNVANLAQDLGGDQRLELAGRVCAAAGPRDS